MRGDAMISFYMSEQHHFSPFSANISGRIAKPLTLFKEMIEIEKNTT